MNNKNPINNIYVSPRKQRNALKDSNNLENNLEQLYENEPHLKKILFQKPNNVKNSNRKVAFLKHYDNKNKNIVNTLKMNKSIIILDKNDYNKSKIFDNDKNGNEHQ